MPKQHRQVQKHQWFGLVCSPYSIPIDIGVYVCEFVTSDGYVCDIDGNYFHYNDVFPIDPDDIAPTASDIQLTIDLLTTLFHEDRDTFDDVVEYLLKECSLALWQEF